MPRIHPLPVRGRDPRSADETLEQPDFDTIAPGVEHCALTDSR
jgi:hypothetical protein